MPMNAVKMQTRIPTAEAIKGYIKTSIEVVNSVVEFSLRYFN